MTAIKPPANRRSAYFLLISVSFILSILTVVMAALPLKLIRSAYGFFAYLLASLFIIGIAVLLKLPLLVVSLIGVVTMLGLYSEFESRKVNWIWSGFVSLLVGSGALWGALEVWMKMEGWNLTSKFNEQIEKFLSQIATINPNTGITAEAILIQMPSVVVSGLLIALALSITFEKRFLVSLKLLRLHPFGNVKPKEFRVPDLFVWITMLAFLLSFKNFGLKGLEAGAMNILNVMVILFLFQGVAVTEAVFSHYRVGPFMRMLFFLILILQLFFVLSAIGFADFWLDIRKRLKNTKQPAEQN